MELFIIPNTSQMVSAIAFRGAFRHHFAGDYTNNISSCDVAKLDEFVVI